WCVASPQFLSSFYSQQPYGVGIMQTQLAKFVKRAWHAGASVDLNGVGYGRDHVGPQVWVTPADYYRFLAGISRLLGAQNILEIGTHWGGSCVALTRGAVQGGARPLVATVDYLPTVPESSMINKIVGDANTYAVCRKISDIFSAVECIDVLYIDADHG